MASSCWRRSVQSSISSSNCTASLKRTRSRKSRRTSSTFPVAWSSSRRYPGPRRRASPSRGNRRQSPTERTPTASSNRTDGFAQRVAARGKAARAFLNSESRLILTALPDWASQIAARGIGAIVSTQVISRFCTSSCRSAQSDSIPPNNSRLPRTSRSRPSGGSTLTREVNRPAQVASLSRKARSLPTSRS